MKPRQSPSWSPVRPQPRHLPQLALASVAAWSVIGLTSCSANFDTTEPVPSIEPLGQRQAALRVEFSDIPSVHESVPMPELPELGESPEDFDPSYQPRDTSSERRAAANAIRRRVIHGDDGDEPIRRMGHLVDGNLGGPSPSSSPGSTRRDVLEAFYEPRLALHANTNVTTHFFATWGVGLGNYTHAVNVPGAHLFTEHLNAETPNALSVMLQHDLDPLAAVVSFARQHDQEVFWTLRMNDNHDAALDEAERRLFFQANTFKRQFVQCQDEQNMQQCSVRNESPPGLIGPFGGPSEDAGGAWSAVNYMRDEVREHVLQVIVDLLGRRKGSDDPTWAPDSQFFYDIDGVHLNFFRHAAFFPETRNQQSAAGQAHIMTELVASVREWLDYFGELRGRPILLAVNVPDRVEYALELGLDVETWMREHYVDLLLPGGYVQLEPWSEIVELAHSHGVKVYPSLDQRVLEQDKGTGTNGGNGEGFYKRLSLPAWRGRALQALSAGADGVHFLNLWPNASNATARTYFDAAHPAQLAQLDRDFFVTISGTRHLPGGSLEFWPEGTPRSDQVPPPKRRLRPGEPHELTPGTNFTVEFRVGDLPPPVQASRPQVRLELRFAGSLDAEDLANNAEVTANGTLVELHEIETTAHGKIWASYAVPYEALSAGRNDVTVQHIRGNALSWEDARLSFRYDWSAFSALL